MFMLMTSRLLYMGSYGVKKLGHQKKEKPCEHSFHIFQSTHNETLKNSTTGRSIDDGKTDHESSP